jgi:hypothetical protein
MPSIKFLLLVCLSYTAAYKSNRDEFDAQRNLERIGRVTKDLADANKDAEMISKC